MRKLSVTEFVSLDGVMEAPGGEPTHPHAGWTCDCSSDEQMAWKFAETMEAESLPIGRFTYESFSAAWPGRDGEFADQCQRDAQARRVVDEYRLMIFPVVLGSGRSCSRQTPDKTALELVDTSVCSRADGATRVTPILHNGGARPARADRLGGVAASLAAAPGCAACMSDRLRPTTAGQGLEP